MSKTEEKKQKKAPLAMTQRGFEPNSIEAAFRFADALAQSDLVPANYRHKPGSCLIALDLASRLNASWLMVMQHVYDVKGRLSLDAQFCIALINQSGLFTDPLDYEVCGKDPFKEDYKVRAFAKRKLTGKTLYGPWIDWKLVKAERWHQKEGSKWLTMPEQMFHYRAASWFKSRHCPEVTMGMLTTEEAAETEETFEMKQVEAVERIDADTGSEPVVVSFENGNEKPDATDGPDEETKVRIAQQEADLQKDIDDLGSDLAEEEPVDQFRCLGKCKETFPEPGQKTGPRNNSPIYCCPHCGSLRIEAIEDAA